MLFRLNAFLSFILVSLGVGIAQGMELSSIVGSLEKGMGDTLGFLIMILGLGAMLGKLVAESGAAQRITSSLIRLFGLKNTQWAVMLTGFIVGITLFYSVGFVILVPLVFFSSSLYQTAINIGSTSHVGSTFGNSWIPAFSPCPNCHRWDV